MECIIAKIFGSEAQKEAAIELFMKTHGGRSFLHGHLFGDNVHEFLAPCIYEGEGEMLGMAFFKSLVKEHGKQFFEPIGKALARRGHQEAEPDEPGARLGAAQGAMVPYAKWRARRDGSPASGTPSCPSMPDEPAPRTPSSPTDGLQRSRLEISERDGQAPAQAGRPPVPDGRAVAAGPGPGRDARDQPLGRASSRPSSSATRPTSSARTSTRKLTGKRPSDAYFRAVTKLGEAIAEGGFEAIAGIEAEAILMPSTPSRDRRLSPARHRHDPNTTR